MVLARWLESSTVAPLDPQQTPKVLADQLKTEFTGLVNDHVELAKLELQPNATRGGVGAGSIALAAVLGVYAIGLFSVALALGLAALFNWPNWLGFLVVGLLYVVVVALLGLVARSQFSKIEKPTRTIESLKTTLATLKSASSR